MSREEAIPTSTQQEVVPVHLDLRELRSLGDLVTVETAPPTQPRGGGRGNWLFIASFIVPVLLGGVYLFFVAADRYQSETRFIVRSTEGGGVSMDLGAAMMDAKLSRAGEDAYIVNEFILSRDALGLLGRAQAIAPIFSRAEADVFARYPPAFGAASQQKLFDHYKSMVKTWVDSSTGISTIEVTAFRPDDAQVLARAILGIAESEVNSINDRANRDRVAFAEQILGQAKETVEKAERELTAFRNASGVVDPMREYQAALQNIGRLTTEASQREAALNQQIALTPNGPGIASLREKVKSFHDEIARQNEQLAGGGNSLAVKLATFDQLSLEREIATKQLATAEVNLDASRKEAGQQRLYLQPIVDPHLPDRPSGPKRFLWFAVVLGASLTLYYTLKQLKGLAEEHAA